MNGNRHESHETMGDIDTTRARIITEIIHTTNSSTLDISIPLDTLLHGKGLTSDEGSEVAEEVQLFFAQNWTLWVLAIIMRNTWCL